MVLEAKMWSVPLRFGKLISTPMFKFNLFTLEKQVLFKTNRLVQISFESDVEQESYEVIKHRKLRSEVQRPLTFVFTP